MKKTILSLFILATLGITSCSSDSNSDSSTNPNDLVVVAFKATGEGTNIENFARDKEGTKVLSLDGQSNNASFTEVTITKNGINSNSSFTISGRNVTTKSDTSVGEYSISYRITNGTTTSNLTTQSFTVYYDENKTVDGVTATIYQFRNDYLNDSNDPNEHQTFDGIKVPITPNTKPLNGVPYQFLVGSRLYQLSLENPGSETQYDFSNRDNDGQWSICELEPPTDFNSEYTLPTEVINITVRTKKYDQDQNNPINPTIMFYELKLDSDVLNYSNFTDTELTPNDIITFGTDQI